MQNDKQYPAPFNFFKYEPQYFAFAGYAPKPAPFSFAETVGTIKFEFDPKKKDPYTQSNAKVYFYTITESEQEILLERLDIYYYVLQEFRDENEQEVSYYVKGEKAKLQLIKIDGEIMLVARICVGHGGENASKAPESESKPATTASSEPKPADGESSQPKTGATKHAQFERIVYYMQISTAHFEMDKFLKATGPNLMVRQRNSEKKLMPLVQTFLFKGEGVREIYDEIQKHIKQ